MEKLEVVNMIAQRIPQFAERIAPVYQVLNWKWGEDFCPPSKAEIEKTLTELLDEFEKSKSPNPGISSGGLGIYWDKDNDEFGISFRDNDPVFY